MAREHEIKLEILKRSALGKSEFILKLENLENFEIGSFFFGFFSRPKLVSKLGKSRF